MSNPLIAQFDKQPVLVAPEMAAHFAECLAAVAKADINAELRKERADSGTDDFWTELGPSWSKYVRPYVVKDGVLHIPVKGVLLHDYSYQFGTWATGYTYIQKALERGLADENVKGIALVIDSPGGMVSGCFDLGDRIYESRGVKPIRAFAAEGAYSAAYALFSAAEQGVVARTGGVGSIGVVTAHMDVSEAVEKAGLKVTFIHAGKHKVDGNAYEALPPAVKARIQARIDALYEIFVAFVARNRGLDEQAVRDTEALTFSAPQAVSNGLADSVGALDDALAAFAADLSATEGDDTMSDKDQNGAVDQATHAAAVTAARTEGEASGRATGLTEGVTAERTRIAAILDSDEAKSRPAAARMLAFDTDKDPESALASLAKLPEEAAAAAPAAVAEAAPQGSVDNRFVDSMDNGANPNLGEGDAANADNDDPVALARAAGLGGFREATSKKEG